MKKWIIISSLAIFVYSCTIPMRLFNPSGGLVYKFDGLNTGLDTLINLRGYYRNAISNNDVKFYPNGLICSTYSHSFEKEFIDYQVCWGRYILSGDTVKGQIVIDEGIIGGISSSSFTFRIVSTDSIQGISGNTNEGYQYKPLGNDPDWKDCWLLKKKWFWKRGYYKEY